jgi:hypothetical protein
MEGNKKFQRPIVAINLLSPHKAPGHDLIVATVLKNLPRKAILLISYTYNTSVTFLFRRSLPKSSLYPNRESPQRSDII